MAALVQTPVWATRPENSNQGRPGWRVGVSALVYASGAWICHQRPERSFHRAGAQLPVCARCAGLYAAGLLGVIVWAVVTGTGRAASARARRFVSQGMFRSALIASALPTIVTVAAAWLGWWEPGNAVRALLATPLGAAIGGTIAAVAAGDLR